MTQKQADDTASTLEPCHHMEHWVNGMADGSLKGVARLYTRLHVAGCIKCHTALLALEKLRHRLHDLNHSPEAEIPSALTSDRRAALDAAMDEIDKKQEEPAGL
jgi:hypothetical protein